MEPIKVIVIGAGDRGRTYTNIMKNHPDKFKVVGVAEPIVSRRESVKEIHDIPEENCYVTWEHILDRPKFADVAIISTMDQLHFEPAMKALELGYDLLLEKPVSPSPEECGMIYKQAEKYGRKIMVCHVLRYTPYFMQLKKIIGDDILGKVVAINHTEAVGNVHQSHSFVRGNWGNSKESSVMFLQKSCHDTDILQWLLGKKCLKVQSFGNLSYFKEENAPEGSPEYCIQGCPAGDTCPYNAVKLYLEDKKNKWFRDASTKIVDPTDEQVKDAITNTQYGKCVYKCNNDVVDHQIVNMLFEDDITVTFTMNAFNKGGRFIHIMGTKGKLRAAMDGEKGIEFFDLETQKSEFIPIVAGDGIKNGHGGGDRGIVTTLYKSLTGTYDGKSIPGIQESCYSHMIVFAAEQARATDTVVNVEEYIASL